jgi:hypothetical protein
MAREHEMVSSGAPIPVGIFVGYDGNVIGEDATQTAIKSVGVKPVKAVNNLADA